MRVIFIAFISGVVLATASCSKREPQAEAPPRLIDACTLLTREEVSTVLGLPVQETKQSARPASDATMSQCYFVLPTNADSINVVLTQRIDSNSPRDPRKAWQTMFLDERPVKMGHDGKPKDQPRPERISGLGEDAFWAGGRFGGTLNVLKGNALVQISVGGSGDESAKLEKLKELARLIVGRLD